MSKKVKIGLVQLKDQGSPKANLKKHIDEIKQCAQDDANIIVLQELFLSHYFCDIENNENFDLAIKIPGELTNTFCELAKKLNVVLVLSLFEKRAEGLYHNTAAVIDADGSYMGKYRKNHIPDDPGYYEKFYFTPGDLGYKVFETKFAKIGVLICWDQWYPEAARLTALKGAEVLVYPTAIGWADDESHEDHKEQLDAWQTIQRSHAIANGIPVVSVNRVGKEAKQTFWGNSFVCNSMGSLISKLGTEEQTEVVNVDLAEAENYRRTWPFFRDRRIDTYENLNKRWDDSEEDS
jgi:N-carbamoylputrescine amidase